MNPLFGVFIQQDSHLSEEVNRTKGPQFYFKVASLAEGVGFHSFWYADHWMLPRNKATFDCWSLLSGVAAITDKLWIGSLVTSLTANNPVALAKRVLTVQMISRNRVIFGIGTGFYKHEYEAFGVRYPGHQQRLKMLEEGVALIRRVWKANEPVTYDGEAFSVKGALLLPRTVMPPFWFGGVSDGILQIIAKYGDGWIPYEISCDHYAERARQIDSLLDKLHRDKDEVRKAYSTRVIARKTEEEALAVLRRIGVRRDYESPTGQKGHIIVGSYEQCRAELANYLEVGVEYLLLSPQPIESAYELLPILKKEFILKK